MTIYQLTTENCIGAYHSIYFINIESAYDYIRDTEFDAICGLYEVNTAVDNDGVITATKNRIARPRSAREKKYNITNKNENYID